MYVCVMMCMCPPTVVKYPFILCVQCLINHTLPPSFTALTPKDFSDFFQPVFKQGAHLKNKWATKGSTMPKVTVCVCTYTRPASTTYTSHTRNTHTHNTHTVFDTLEQRSPQKAGLSASIYVRTYVCMYKLRTAKGATVCACLCVNHYCMLYALNAQE